MKHPTKQQMQSVIDTLEQAVELAERNCPVDMGEGKIYRDHPCGTPMCFAGWYGLVTSNKGNFLEGRSKIVNALGFKCSYELKKWAGENPEIWGNKYGLFMFSDDRSFTGDSDTEIPNLQYIINHLKGVKERLPE